MSFSPLGAGLQSLIAEQKDKKNSFLPAAITLRNK